jgi:hypothetical protein
LVRKKADLPPLPPLCALSDKEYVDLLERVFAHGVVLEMKHAARADTVAAAGILRMDAGMTWRVLDELKSKKKN